VSASGVGVAPVPARQVQHRQAELTRVSDLLRVPTGPVDLATFATDATPGLPDPAKPAAKVAMSRLGPRLAELQEQLYAEGHTGGTRSVLLVLQGMDAAGKGATVGHVLGLVNPMGVRYHGFTPPTIEEREHHFLWRVRRRLPPPGTIGVFDRSHYEDVLVVRVHNLVPPELWSGRYEVINRFEAKLATSTRIVKCFLHISRTEQRRRLLARLSEPTMYWKYSRNDVLERAQWDEYQRAYADVLQRCNSETAPWYAVPSDHKWYRNWAITSVLVEQLEAMSPRWPPPQGWDPETERQRLTTGH
jgi:PPK2 family polyphosphate:nucleotide phosphotransferase